MSAASGTKLFVRSSEMHSFVIKNTFVDVIDAGCPPALPRRSFSTPRSLKFQSMELTHKPKIRSGCSQATLAWSTGSTTSGDDDSCTEWSTSEDCDIASNQEQDATVLRIADLVPLPEKKCRTSLSVKAKPWAPSRFGISRFCRTWSPQFSLTNGVPATEPVTTGRNLPCIRADAGVQLPATVRGHQGSGEMHLERQVFYNFLGCSDVQGQPLRQNPFEIRSQQAFSSYSMRASSA